MIKSLKQYLSLRGLLCSAGLHCFKKVDKNINHDFLECSCGKRKFKCDYWEIVNEPIREIIFSWVDHEITQKEAWDKIMERQDKKRTTQTTKSL